MIQQTVDQLLDSLSGALSVDGDQVSVVDEKRLREQVGDLVYNAVFAQGLVRDTARWLLWQAGQSLGIYPASIHDLYMAAGRGELPKRLTVPAINVRALNYTMSRAIFRAANKLDVGALIFEIARSEMGYTDQRPAEYVAAVTGAAIKEGYRGPLFIQGDHFQVSAKGYAADAEKEVGAVKDLIEEAIAAGFYNIDIDTSTLVDLDFEGLDDQQRHNYEVCAELTRHTRQHEPEGVTVSLGGEIGEVGGHNSTIPELRAFMDGYYRVLGEVAGISKISVQTGTSHGGVVLPDGTLAQVKVDFDTLAELSRVSREEYGIGGAVQHGASTLPPSAFDRFPLSDALEIHLATGFQNIIFDELPAEVVDQAYSYLYEKLKGEWQEGKTEDQFLYSTRKKAIAPYKKAWWDLDQAIQERIGAALQEQFEFLFEKLAVTGTRAFAQALTPQIRQDRPRPTEAAQESELQIAADLAD
ncbi:MAG TPA: aldolase [Anaerolineae bacterium]|nr:aldolase [Anaerolineae bacterium]